MRLPAAFAFLVVFIVTSGSFGCSKISVSSNMQRPNHTTLHGIVRYGLASDINTLNPLVTTLAVEQEIDEAIFDGLIELDDRHRVIPDLATEVPTIHNGDISRDGRTLIYHLRHNVTWQDGQQFTAADVLFTFHTILDPRVNDANTAVYRQVEAISAPDNYTVAVRLKTPSAVAVNQLFCNGEEGAILPKHLLEHSADFNRDPFASHPVGTGPMQLERWERSSRVILRPNPHYFRGAPRIQELQILFVPDTNTRLTMVATGELDVATIPLATQLPRLRRLPGYSVTLADSYTGVHLTFNLTRDPFNDLRVRQALTMALDRHKYVTYTYGESGVFADSFIPPYSWAYTSDNHTLGYDPARANMLLDESGWLRQTDGIRAKGGRRLAFSLLTYASNTPRTILAEQMQNAWRAIGADVTIHPMAINMLFARDSILSTARYDVVLEGFVYDPDPDRTSNFGSHDFSPVGFNDSRFSSPQFDALSLRGISLYDQDARKPIYEQLQQLLNEQVPAVPLAWPKTIYVINNDLRGFRPEPVNSDFWNIQDWQI